MESAAPPRIVGRYALFDVIASGGMASVHLGRLMGPVGFSRTVAIKRLHENYARDPEFVAMFLDEARLVARIRHPNVVPTLDVVALEHELLLVMEYVVGIPLGTLSSRSLKAGQPVPVPIVVDIMVNVLNGLHAAHEAANEDGQPLNIVHRDVSPQNVLVGADGIARVLDFGVAKAVGRMHQTRDGQIKGKLRYMAPEHVLGQGVSSVADVYSSSVVLWETLTGQRLFVGDDDAQVMYRVLEGNIAPPSRFCAEVSKGLDDVVLRGLSKDPRARYGTAKEMARALEDTVTAVRRRDVSDWVSRVAADYIDQSQQRVARVESSGTPRRRPSNPPPRALQVVDRESNSESGSTLRTASALSHPSVPIPSEAQSSLPRAPRVALLAVLAVAATVWFLFGRGPVTASGDSVHARGLLGWIRAGTSDRAHELVLGSRAELATVLQPEEGALMLHNPARPDDVDTAPPRPARRAPRARPAKTKAKKSEPIYRRD